MTQKITQKNARKLAETIELRQANGYAWHHLLSYDNHALTAIFYTGENLKEDRKIYKDIHGEKYYFTFQKTKSNI